MQSTTAIAAGREGLQDKCDSLCAAGRIALAAARSLRAGEPDCQSPGRVRPDRRAGPDDARGAIASRRSSMSQVIGHARGGAMPDAGVCVFEPMWWRHGLPGVGLTSPRLWIILARTVR